ncbi:MAG: response regulator [Burkholderiaceae bacterium]
MTDNADYDAVKFLIVDDDEVSVMAIKRAMQKLKLANPVRVAKDGIEALEILRGNIDVDQILPPYIITLDLSMPRMGGKEFLEEVRRDPVLQQAVIFVLTTSDAPGDIAAAYEKNIAGYIVKEPTTESLAEALSLISDYAQLVVLPRPNDSDVTPQS